MRNWVITKDHIDGGSKHSAVGAPSDRAQEIIKSGTAFRLYDDDGELYYEGRFLMHPEHHTGFEPLDWAMNNMGCTEIKYFEQGRWATL